MPARELIKNRNWNSNGGVDATLDQLAAIKSVENKNKKPSVRQIPSTSRGKLCEW